MTPAPAARNYTDVALTPDTEESPELLEVLSAHTPAEAGLHAKQEADRSQSLVGSP